MDPELIKLVIGLHLGCKLPFSMVQRLVADAEEETVFEDHLSRFPLARFFLGHLGFDRQTMTIFTISREQYEQIIDALIRKSSSRAFSPQMCLDVVTQLSALQEPESRRLGGCASH